MMDLTVARVMSRVAIIPSANGEFRMERSHCALGVLDALLDHGPRGVSCQGTTAAATLGYAMRTLSFVRHDGGAVPRARAQTSPRWYGGMYPVWTAPMRLKSTCPLLFMQRRGWSDFWFALYIDVAIACVAQLALIIWQWRRGISIVDMLVEGASLWSVTLVGSIVALMTTNLLDRCSATTTHFSTDI